MNTETPFLDEIVDWMGSISHIDRKSEYIRLFREHPHFCHAPIVTEFLADQFYPSLLDGIAIPPSEEDIFLLRALPSIVPYILARIDDKNLAVQLRLQAVGLLLESRHPERKKYLQKYMSHVHPSIRTAAKKALERYTDSHQISKIKSKKWLHIPCSQKWSDMSLREDVDQRHCNRCSHTVTRIFSLAALENSQGCVLFDPVDQNEMSAVQNVYQCTEDEEDKPKKEKEERVVPLPPGAMIPRPYIDSQPDPNQEEKKRPHFPGVYLPPKPPKFPPELPRDSVLESPPESVPESSTESVPESQKSGFWSWLKSLFSS